MRHFTSAVALTAVLLTIAGCQSKEAKIESKQSASEDRQKEITRLQNQWNSVMASSAGDCRVNPRTLQVPKTAQCVASNEKAHEIEEKLKQLTAEQAAE